MTGRTRLGIIALVGALVLLPALAYLLLRPAARRQAVLQAA